MNKNTTEPTHFTADPDVLHSTLEDWMLMVFGALPRGEIGCVCVGEGGTINRPATARNIAALPVGRDALYVCVSTVAHTPFGAEPFRRSSDRLMRARLVVFDDIGTKCQPPALPPSYILQTSVKDGNRPNYQYEIGRAHV